MANAILVLAVICFLSVNARAQSLDLVQDQEIQALVASALQAGREDVFTQGLVTLANEAVQTGLDADLLTAQRRLVAKVDSEQWTLGGIGHFDFWQSLFRNQGLACDGQNNFWYSGTYSLSNTYSKTGWTKSLRLLPLPVDLIERGDDHIGDIDYSNGILYVPAEDGGQHYQNPYVVLYDATTFEAQQYFRLPVDAQAEGVPWIAVDPAHGRAFSALYYDVNQINVYDLQTFELTGHIALSQTIHNWQGAKIAGGFLYATSDDDPSVGKFVYKIDLDSGTVMRVATIPADVTELEGLAFSSNNGELEMDTLGLSRSGTGLARDLSMRAQLDMFQISLPSIRDQLRAKLISR